MNKVSNIFNGVVFFSFEVDEGSDSLLTLWDTKEDAALHGKECRVALKLTDEQMEVVEKARAAFEKKGPNN